MNDDDPNAYEIVAGMAQRRPALPPPRPAPLAAAQPTIPLATVPTSPPGPVASQIPPAQVVREEYVVRRVITEHYVRLPDGSLVPTIPEGTHVLAPVVLPHGAGAPRLPAPPLLPVVYDGTHSGAGGTVSPPHAATRPLTLVSMLMIVLIGLWWLAPRLLAVAAVAPAEDTAVPPPAPAPPPIAPAAAPAPLGEVVGPPSLTAQQIDSILARYDSPAAGSGQAWVARGTEYGIDPAYALAFFVHESTAGTASGWAGWKPDGSSTHNVGNIICAGYATCHGRFRDYPDWDTGIRDWYRLIRDEYIAGRGLTTVAQIIPVYAPSFENDVAGYVATVEGLVAQWRAEAPAADAPAPEPPPAATPAPAAEAGMPLDFTLSSLTANETQTTVRGLLHNAGATPVSIAPEQIVFIGVDHTEYAIVSMPNFTLQPGQTADLTVQVPAPPTGPLTLIIRLPSGELTVRVRT